MLSIVHGPLGNNSPTGYVRGRMAGTRALEGSQLTWPLCTQLQCPIIPKERQCLGLFYGALGQRWEQRAEKWALGWAKTSAFWLNARETL